MWLRASCFKTGFAASWGGDGSPEGGVAGIKSKVFTVTCVTAFCGTVCDVTCTYAVTRHGCILRFRDIAPLLNVQMCVRLETPMSRLPHFYIGTYLFFVFIDNINVIYVL